ncbi:MAG TPA: 2-oxoacid:ferredoxin oxidoreductase subunit beta [Bacillota bacterium]|nr:2-oxoacid:ferredoxin oxidoreductase subunit beta [Bacillota bacterium]
MSAALVSPKSFVSEERPTWCPGCGDFAVLQALQRASAQLGLQPHEMAVVSGIGCSGKISSYFNSYGLHVLHGRSVPCAIGVKLANPNLTVIASGGDGDGYGIGGNHFLNAIRRNIDITYIVMDNQVYGLTKGQTSPTSAHGYKSTTSPAGSAENPMHPLRLALANGASFIAQGFSAERNQLIDIIVKAIAHKGFSLVNAISPCVTFNKVNTYDWYRERLHNLDDDKTHNPSDRGVGFNKLIEHGDLVRGVIYAEETPSYDEYLPGYTGASLADMAKPTERSVLEKMMAEYR